MKKASVIAIPHPDVPELFLHGRRKDNKKWTIPGGCADKNESPEKCAARELYEETGLKINKLQKWGSKGFTDKDNKVEVTLFTAKCPDNLNLKVRQDPDSEFECFKFLNPLTHGNLHVPIERNILLDYLNER
jgi:8-oxo-dGTP pyrophosphatase MutT (NUDIX family)